MRSINLKNMNTDLGLLLDLEAKPKNKIKVSGKLSKPHSLIITAKEALENGFVDRFGTLYPPACFHEVANIRASKDQLNRSLRIADALFKSIETRRGEIKIIHPENHRNCKTLICILGQEIEIKLEEISKKAKPYRQARARGETCYYRPTGRMRLKIDTWVDGKQPAVLDTEDGRLEGQLNVFMTELYKEAFRKRQNQEEIQKWRDAYKKREAEQKLRDQIEQAQIKELEQQADAFDKSNKIRTFLQSLEESSVNKNPAWLKWAYHYADSIDPLK